MENKIEYKVNKVFAIINTIGAVFIILTAMFLFAVKQHLNERMDDLASKAAYYNVMERDYDIMDTYIRIHPKIRDDFYDYYKERTMEISDTN